MLIVACGLSGILLAPRERPTGREGFAPAPGSNLRGEAPRSRRPSSPRDGAGGTPREPTPGRSMRTPYHVIEQDSPAINGDGLLTESIGIEMPRGTFVPVLEAGAVQPAWAARTYGTARPEQTRLRLHLVRGKSDRVAENRSLGWIELTDFEPGPNDLAMVAIALRVADGNIVLGAVDVTTQRPVSVSMIESPLLP